MMHLAGAGNQPVVSGVAPCAAGAVARSGQRGVGASASTGRDGTGIERRPWRAANSWRNFAVAGGMRD